jgi:hypothetical protein
MDFLKIKFGGDEIFLEFQMESAIFKNRRNKMSITAIGELKVY